jgi:hypothetical protein
MSCYDREKYLRAKDLELMKILGIRTATLTEEPKIIVKRTHGVYGQYYAIISEAEVKDNNETVVFKCKPLSPVKVPSSAGKRKLAEPDN